jgi:uncharacterized spore protein YtfJ
MADKSAGAHGLLATLSERFRDAATVKLVYGEPIEAAGKTVIPVARVAFGFGGGSAPQPRRHAGGEGAEAEAEGKDEAAGGGGGIYATPVGVVEIDGEGTRFVRFGQELHLGLAFAAGLLLGLALARSRRGGDDED